VKEHMDAVVEITREAGRIVMGFYKAKVATWDKSPGNPVTEADLAADAHLREKLTALVPGSGWLSEETKDSPERLSKRQVWVVDPIDGTREFMNGVPEFCVCVALVEDGDPILSVLFNPARDELFTGLKGGGATLNGEPIHVLPEHSWAGSHFLVSRSEHRRGEWEPYAEQHIEPCGSIAYKMAGVAAGRAHASFSRGPKNEWDVCAGALLVTEAGGWAGTLAGIPYRFNSPDPLVDGVVTTIPSLLPKILASVEAHGRVRQGERK